MNNFFTSLFAWTRWGASATGDSTGVQSTGAGASLVDGVSSPAIDSALQLDTVWACIDRRATTIASLPLFVYKRDARGQKELARAHSLWRLLHDSPNARMTPYDFWRVMVMNHDLRGNAYARIERNDRGEVSALWPMPADQVSCAVLESGELLYKYTINGEDFYFPEDAVLHLRNLGNGTVGMDKLDFMRAGVAEAGSQVQSASKVWASSGKPTGVLMIDHVLKPEQRTALLSRFAGMTEGSASRLYLLEANMKYQQLSISPEQQQMLESRRFSVEQMCRWYDVPPVLVHHANVTTWGSGIEQIMDGFYKLTIRPMLVQIEQALAKRVLSPAERVKMSVEFSLDALLRGNASQRAEVYSKLLQNGVITIAEARQLEGWPQMDGTDGLNVQSNLVPLRMLGQQQGANNASSQVSETV
jgi:HK97 family phage portal protein